MHDSDEGGPWLFRFRDGTLMTFVPVDGRLEFRVRREHDEVSFEVGSLDSAMVLMLANWLRRWSMQQVDDVLALEVDHAS